MDIKIGRSGKILSGSECGSYIKIIDDSENTSGFLILTSASSDFKTGFDNWVEDFSSIEKYFAESGWSIEWLE